MLESLARASLEWSCGELRLVAEVVAWARRQADGGGQVTVLRLP